jgi:hypothetical protein
MTLSRVNQNARVCDVLISKRVPRVEEGDLISLIVNMFDSLRKKIFWKLVP